MLKIVVNIQGNRKRLEEIGVDAKKRKRRLKCIETVRYFNRRLIYQNFSTTPSKLWNFFLINSALWGFKVPVTDSNLETKTKPFVPTRVLHIHLSKGGVQPAKPNTHTHNLVYRYQISMIPFMIPKQINANRTPGRLLSELKFYPSGLDSNHVCWKWFVETERNREEGLRTPVCKRNCVRDCDVVAIRVRKTGSTRSSLDSSLALSWQIHLLEDDDSGRKRIFCKRSWRFFFLFFQKGKEPDQFGLAKFMV